MRIVHLAGDVYGYEQSLDRAWSVLYYADADFAARIADDFDLPPPPEGFRFSSGAIMAEAVLAGNYILAHIGEGAWALLGAQDTVILEKDHIVIRHPNNEYVIAARAGQVEVFEP
jgi:hypothetical protein